MKDLFAKALLFIRENPSLIYSLVLVIIIPAAFFLNTYLITNNFENDIDRITQINALSSENIIKLIAKNQLADPQSLQENINNIIKENDNIADLTILQPNATHESFSIIASANEETIGQTSESIQDLLAWKQPEGIAFLVQNDQERFWRITKSFNNPSGEKTALISIAFSLKDTDKLIADTINRAYLILIITILVVILFVSNQARLFGYALALSKLKEVDQMKDTFISMASHELRSPLTAIRGYLEFLDEKIKKNPDEESQHYLTNITISTDRLNNLVNDMLEVSRLEGNRIPIEIKSFDPNPLVAQSIEELRSQAIIKNLELSYTAGEPISIDADPERFKQVVINLIGNAIKYTPQGSVTISSEIKDKRFLLTVADTGIGISAEDQTKLFQKFSRIQNDKTKSIIGTGLGLWITMELIRRMNGKITVESIEGVGSHFTVSFPLAKK